MGKYIITSIEKVEPPEGSENKSWYRYIIQNDINTITSLRSGSKNEVQQFATEAIKRLNEIYPDLSKVKNYNRPVNENVFSSYL